jgi:hypothetical protein
MGAVGSFPGIDLKRMTIRAPVNELDKTTIISILPKHILEVKHTIQPGKFEIQKGSIQNPSILVVGPSSWWKETDEGQPFLEIPHSSIQIAHSVVRDYCVGLLGCDMADKRPGLFYIPGNITLEELQSKKEYVAQIQQANIRQRNWFGELVKIADVLWARTNGNPLTISDDMKLAARELGLDKSWIKDFQTVAMVNCPACGTLKNPNYPVCPNCKAITDSDKAKSLGIQFAQ